MSGLWVTTLLIVTLVVAGVIGYHFLEGYTWLEALYMTVITLSTVGYREVKPLSSAGQIFTSPTQILSCTICLGCMTFGGQADKETSLRIRERRRDKGI